MNQLTIPSFRHVRPIVLLVRCLIYCVFIGAGSVMAGSINNQNNPLDNRDGSSEKYTLKGIKGRVSVNGTPLNGTLIEAKSLDRPTRMIPEIAILSDDSGNYRWPLPPGRYIMTARLDHYWSQSKSVVVETEKAATVNFVMMPIRRTK